MRDGGEPLRRIGVDDSGDRLVSCEAVGLGVVVMGRGLSSLSLSCDYKTVNGFRDFRVAIVSIQ